MASDFKDCVGQILMNLNREQVEELEVSVSRFQKEPGGTLLARVIRDLAAAAQKDVNGDGEPFDPSNEGRRNVALGRLSAHSSYMREGFGLLEMIRAAKMEKTRTQEE